MFIRRKSSVAWSQEFVFSEVNRCFSLLIYNQKLHFTWPIEQYYISQLQNVVYCSKLLCNLKPWSSEHTSLPLKILNLWCVLKWLNSLPCQSSAATLLLLPALAGLLLQSERPYARSKQRAGWNECPDVLDTFPGWMSAKCRSAGKQM